MIKLTKHLYIHILTLILFIICAVQGRLFEIGAVYAVMLFHECAHLVAAICIGLRVSHIVLYPFGVNLKLKNKLICSVADEIILYASGPFMNVILALICMLIYRHFPIYQLQYLYIANIMLFITNLLPVSPLDGGIILKKILMYFLGTKSSNIIVKVISAFLSAVFIVFGVYAVYCTEGNFSILLLAVLLVGNLFTQKEKYNIDCIKELMFYKNKSKNKVEIKVFSEDKPLYEILKALDFCKYSIIFLTDEDGKVKKILTETEIVSNLIG